MCLTVKEVKEILDGMRDDALVLADKELQGDAAHELTAYEYPSGDKKDWNFVILTWEKQKGDKMKFNFINCIEFEIDWKAVAAIAACVLGYAIITVIQKGEYTY